VFAFCCQLGRLQAQLQELKEEAKNARADPAELRDRLFRKTKEENDKLVAAQARYREILEDSEAKRKVCAPQDANTAGTQVLDPLKNLCFCDLCVREKDWRSCARGAQAT
jgi:hypothetical protein